MSSQKTTNYDLNQWLPDDSVLRTDFNADNAKIDAALSAMSEQVVQKANQSALDTLITAVNQKAGQDDLTALSQTHASDVSQLRAENRLLFLSQASVSASASAYTLTLPSWSGASALQIHYNIIGGGEIQLSFNNYAACYDAQRMTTATAFSLKYDSMASGAGVITLRPCGTSNLVACSVSGLSLNETGAFASYVDVRCSVQNVTVQGLTKLKFESDSGTVQAGSWFRIYKLL